MKTFNLSHLSNDLLQELHRAGEMFCSVVDVDNADDCDYVLTDTNKVNTDGEACPACGGPIDYEQHDGEAHEYGSAIVREPSWREPVCANECGWVDDG